MTSHHEDGAAGAIVGNNWRQTSNVITVVASEIDPLAHETSSLLFTNASAVENKWSIMVTLADGCGSLRSDRINIDCSGIEIVEDGTQSPRLQFTF